MGGLWRSHKPPILHMVISTGGPPNSPSLCTDLCLIDSVCDRLDLIQRKSVVRKRGNQMAENNTAGGLEQDSTSEQQGRADGVITVVLTADNHLGYTAFGQPPRKREERQQ